MRRIAVLLLLILPMVISTNTALAEQRRIVWDMNQLPVLPDSQTRAMFGFEALTSIQDDYSWMTNMTGTNHFQSVLKPCSEFSQIDMNYTACIEKFSYRKVGATVWNDAQLSQVQLGEPTTTIMKGNAQVGKVSYDASILRPEGFKSTLWTLSGAPHASGNDYLLRARFIGDTSATTQQNFYLELMPAAYPQGSSTITQDQIRVQEFPQDVEYRVRLRLGVFIKTLTGWFFGRMSSPTIDRNGPQGYLDVTGTPARVPIGLTEPVPVEGSDKYFDPAWCADVSAQLHQPCGSINKLYGKAFSYSVSEHSDPSGLNLWEAAPGGVKTVATLSDWKISSAYFWDVQQNSSNSLKCASNLYGVNARVFLGAVFSNASLFQTQPPKWDAESESFSFQVASPHLDENKKPNKGFYTLYVPLDLANCLWGSATSEPKAQVAIINADGQSTLTTAVTKVENGNLRFNIAGFGYSSPTIKVSMTKSFPAQTQITITCTKGKVVKKVTGLKPVCPKGYKSTGK